MEKVREPHLPQQPTNRAGQACPAWPLVNHEDQTGSPADAKQIALQFNAQISAHDIEGLGALMTADHRFIDRDGQVTAGKEAMLDAWMRFFALFPDYYNTFTRVVSQGNLVVMCGYATWEAGAAPDHAIWTARIEGGLVAEWRIVTDNEENRNRLGLGESND